MLRRLALLCLAVGLLAACALYARQEAVSTPLRQTAPLGQRIGDLTLTGAVEWSSPRGDFGGFSGLALEEDGFFTALTDKAHWARSRLVLDGNGALTGVEGLEVGRLHDAAGDYLQFPHADSESLTRGPDGAWYIGFEYDERIARYPDLRAPEETVAPAPDWSGFDDNGTLESLMALPDGRLVAIAERVEDRSMGDFPGWILDGERIGAFILARDGWYQPTDIALGPGGVWVYLLERRFTLVGGFAMRIRRFPLVALAEGARIEATLLLDAPTAPLNENFEGIAAGKDARGRTVLYVISDDNFLALQRTLLLQFRVEREG